MLSPFISLLADIIQLYMLCVAAWAIISTLISFKVINAYQPAVRKIMQTLDKLVLPALKPIRKMLPDLGGVDISPIILWLLLKFAVSELYYLAYHF